MLISNEVIPSFAIIDAILYSPTPSTYLPSGSLTSCKNRTAGDDGGVGKSLMILRCIILFLSIFTIWLMFTIKQPKAIK
jgi:hypothetical protein